MSDNFSNNCILADPCRAADTDACNRLCPSYLAMHGYGGDGGRVSAADIPSAYRPADMTKIYGAQPKLKDIVDAYVATFDRAPSEIKSVYMYSANPGTGKTTTAIMILRAYLVRSYIDHIKSGKQVPEILGYFLDVNAWQSDYLEFNRPRVPDEVAEPAASRYYDKQRIASVVPFAVLDDIGVRESSEGFRADLHRIINERVSKGLPTVYTSNVPLADLNDVFQERPARLVDRIRDRCVNINFVGESGRGLR